MIRSPNAGQTALTLQHSTSPRSGYKPPAGHNADGYTMAERVAMAKGGRSENPIRKTTTGKGANYRKTKSGAGQWSARKAQALAKAYKKAGGGYKS